MEASRRKCCASRRGRSSCEYVKFTSSSGMLTGHSASSLGMMSDEEKKLQRIEDIKELLS